MATNALQSLVNYGPASAGDLTWSTSERTIARKAFDAAPRRRLHDPMRETKQMASQIKKPQV